MTRLSIKTLFLAALWLLHAPAWAQGYPSKPVKIIVPAQPGGGLDLIGRTMADQLGKALEQSFIVENIGGAGGTLACQTVARAAPDGYTLMVGYVATHATSPAVRKVPYDPVRDYTAIAMVGGTQNLLVSGPALPIGELKAFIEHAKKSGGKLLYGSGGIGTLNHLIMEQLKGAAGFDAVTAHYRGIGPAFNDLLASQIQAMTPGLAAALPHIRTKKVRPIAITGQKRHPLLPDVPTFAEHGFKDFDATQWYGIVGPARLPADVTRKLNAEINKAIGAPALRERFAAEAIDPMPMSPEQFGAYIQAEVTRWTALARERRILVED
jgi:tripartite-type tricarboxylate transporter receptor subunit TctC